MPKVRRRKSTNLFLDEDFDNLISGTGFETRRFKLVVSGATSDHCTIDKKGNGATTSSGNIAFNASRANVKTAIAPIMTDIDNAGGNSENGPLGTDPVGFLGTVDRGAEVTVTDSLTPATATVDLSQRIVNASWEWDKADIWRDAGTSRGLMAVNVGMSFTAKPSGKWDLTYKVQNFTRRHEWVYKLDAIDSEGEHLFTLVTPAITCSPADRLHNISLNGRSQEVSTYFGEISTFVRRGSGLYRV